MSDNQPTIGRHLFDSITLGMYDNPMCVFREYIQNSADAIDRAVREKDMERRSGLINISIDPDNRKISVEDNGCGVEDTMVKKILLSIGESEKINTERERGFRGIGRLGGMAYCDELQFVTKAKGSKKISINTWDCKKLKEMLNPNKSELKGVPLEDVIKKCTSFSVDDGGQTNDHYFKVIMKGVKSTNDKLLDIAEVRTYLSQVAPAPFDYQKFSFGKELDELMKKDVPNFNTFKIVVNYEEIFKPYKKTLQLSKNKTDTVSGILAIDILDSDGKLIAKGWRAERKDYLGAILKTENIEGIRVRVGNIQIGDEDILSEVFKEGRFNSYFIGEIHAIDQRLVPNSRRDDFEDNPTREEFYSSIEKELGKPLSELVREKSSDNTKYKVIKNAEDICLKVKESAGKGFVSDKHKRDAIKDLRSAKDELERLNNKKKLDNGIRKDAEKKIGKIEDVLGDISKDSKDSGILEQLSDEYTAKEKSILKDVFDYIYQNHNKTGQAVELVSSIVKYLNRLK